MNRNDAERIALEHIYRIDDQDELVIRVCLESDSAWIFGFDSVKHADTGRFEDALFGLPPVFVSKRDGRLWALYTGSDPEEAFDNYRKHGSPFPPGDIHF